MSIRICFHPRDNCRIHFPSIIHPRTQMDTYKQKKPLFWCQLGTPGFVDTTRIHELFQKPQSHDAKREGLDCAGVNWLIQGVSMRRRLTCMAAESSVSFWTLHLESLAQERPSHRELPKQRSWYRRGDAAMGSLAVKESFFGLNRRVHWQGHGGRMLLRWDCRVELRSFSSPG